MKYITLGNSGLKVSMICVGGMSFGERLEGWHQWTLNQQDTQKMIARALSLGVNFIDTANTYAGGTSEEFIGKALKALKVRRSEVVLASKVYFNEGGLSAQAIAREIDGTLKRLDTDYLDLYQIHRFDYEHPIEETMKALDSLVKSGKVRAIGASAMYGYQFHNMQVTAERNGWTLFSTMQNHYNLIYREDERELIPICRQYNVSLIPYSPLAGGHLTHTGWESGSRRSGTDEVMRAKYDSYRENNLQIIERVNELAGKYGVSMTRIALAWLFARGVASPIVGATKAEHFEDAVKAVDLELTNEDLAYLEELYMPHKITGALPQK